MTDNLLKLKNRADTNDLVLKELNYRTMKRGQGIECEISGKKGVTVPICIENVNRPYCGCEGEYIMSDCPYGLNSNGKCRNSYVVKCCIENYSNILDLVSLTN